MHWIMISNVVAGLCRWCALYNGLHCFCCFCCCLLLLLFLLLHFQVSLGQYLSEIDVALQQNRKKREQVQSSGRDYIRTICTLHKMRRRRIYFVDNTGKVRFPEYFGGGGIVGVHGAP